MIRGQKMHKNKAEEIYRIFLLIRNGQKLTQSQKSKVFLSMLSYGDFHHTGNDGKDRLDTFIEIGKLVREVSIISTIPFQDMYRNDTDFGKEGFLLDVDRHVNSVSLSGGLYTWNDIQDYYRDLKVRKGFSSIIDALIYDAIIDCTHYSVVVQSLLTLYG